MILSDLVSLWLQEEEVGGEQDALDLYQNSLGELLLLLAGEVPVTTLPELLLACPHHVPSLSLQWSPRAGGGSCFTLRCPLGLGGLRDFIFPFDPAFYEGDLGFLWGVSSLGVRPHRPDMLVVPCVPSGSDAQVRTMGQGAAEDPAAESWLSYFSQEGFMEDSEGSCSDGIEGSGKQQE